MRHIGEERRLETVEFAQLGDGRGLLDVETGVLQCDAHLGSQRAVDIDVVLGEAVRLVRLHVKHAQQFIADDHRDRHFRARIRQEGIREKTRIPVAEHIIGDDRSPVPGGIGNERTGMSR